MGNLIKTSEKTYIIERMDSNQDRRIFCILESEDDAKLFLKDISKEDNKSIFILTERPVFKFKGDQYK